MIIEGGRGTSYRLNTCCRWFYSLRARLLLMQMLVVLSGKVCTRTNCKALVTELVSHFSKKIYSLELLQFV